jgi:hypothetical protein
MFDGRFAIPGCPDTYSALLVSTFRLDVEWEDLPEMGLQANVIGSPKAIGNKTLSAMPTKTSFRVCSAGKMRRNMKRKHSLLAAELRK